MESLITLTTDFGGDSPYVAAMKGVILSINPQVRIVDLGHQIAPQNVRHAAFFILNSIPYFPPQAIHVIVVDPGVGTKRELLYVEVNGHRLLAPDNGCWTSLLRKDSPSARVLRLTESRLWRLPLSSTFHGRDILAPIAAHLSLGLEPSKIGETYLDWIRLEIEPPLVEKNRLSGEVIFIDRFGNLITNIPGAEFARVSQQPVKVLLENQIVAHKVRTYREAAPGTAVALISSSDLLEVAVTNGNAAERFGARVGTPVSVEAILPRIDSKHLSDVNVRA
jgi:S-adenosylmethionine hydrolase